MRCSMRARPVLRSCSSLTPHPVRAVQPITEFLCGLAGSKSPDIAGHCRQRFSVTGQAARAVLSSDSPRARASIISLWHPFADFSHHAPPSSIRSPTAASAASSSVSRVIILHPPDCWRRGRRPRCLAPFRGCLPPAAPRRSSRAHRQRARSAHPSAAPAPRSRPAC